ncbi:hypothetical protein NC651_036074 [Populus alba x Populus x berolinensis]|nr:hypothetical protein NC651_036074 [Populus alba x Populus x berolinensis]
MRECVAVLWGATHEHVITPMESSRHSFSY